MPPYTLHWEFRNGHKWWQNFESKWKLEDYIKRCGLDSHPDITNIKIVDNKELIDD
jgi:hypothetical protein